MSNPLYLLGREGEDESPCPVCGNEERHARTGLLTCECPAPTDRELRQIIDAMADVELPLTNWFWTCPACGSAEMVSATATHCLGCGCAMPARNVIKAKL